ncbi:MAG: Na+/H+ antiporter NhaC family protein, partial [Defluviitaleaceae bacterium]|nr:Na+/H+ antiporter NhaC family protein [Defluviitaleaceae bacterium]
MDKNSSIPLPPPGAGLSLVPFLVFIGLFLGVGVFLDSQNVPMAFYQFPAPVAVFVGVVAGFFILKGSINDKMVTFVKGCGEENIIIMIIIFMLANAFSVVAGASGGVDSLVNMGLTFIPPQYLAAGLFIISCIMSICIGTSMGTIAAVGPIAVAIANAANLNMGLVMAGVVGGAMFGDNLSIISDTTIAVTRSLGVEMMDKFKMNSVIAAPAALLTIIIMVITGVPDTLYAADIGEWSLVLIIPYAIVLVAAISGINVFVVLVLGIALSGAVGFAHGAFTSGFSETMLNNGFVEGHFFYGIIVFGQTIQQGFVGMTNVIFTSLLIGGLAAMIRNAGGLEF